MDTITRLLEIGSRIDHLTQSALWIAVETTQKDSGVSQTATLVTVLAEEVREQVYELVRELEAQYQLETLTH